MNIPLGKGDGYTGFIQGGINGQIGLIQGLKILLRGDPVSHADIYTGVRKFLNADLRSRFMISDNIILTPG
jgi:hypothetical protein